MKKLTRWSFNNLHIPMMEEHGVLYCTSKGLCSALGLSEQKLKDVLYHYGDRLHPLRVENIDAKEFFQKHRVEFGIGRVRGDALTWPLKEALGVAFHVHTDLAWEFHQAAIELVVECAKRTVITTEMYQALVARVDAQDAWKKALDDAQPALQSAASAAGTALAAQRQVKHLRLL